MVQKHGANCTSFCTTLCTVLGCKHSFCTILGGSRVRGQRPLSFDPPKPPHFNPLILRGLCPLRIVWGAFWDRGCFSDRLMGRDPYFYSASVRFARITRISDLRESGESCESIRSNHATKGWQDLTSLKTTPPVWRRLWAPTGGDLSAPTSAFTIARFSHCGS